MIDAGWVRHHADRLAWSGLTAVGAAASGGLILHAVWAADPFGAAWASRWSFVLGLALLAGLAGASLGWLLPAHLRRWSWLGSWLALAAWTAPATPAALLALLIVSAGVVLSGYPRLATAAGPIAAALALLAMYLPTAAPGLLLGDSGVLQVSAASLGIPHPTGYPLLMLLAHAAGWTMSDPTFAVTFVSCLGGASAAAVLVLWLQASDIPAPLALPIAVSPFVATAVWTQAVIGEAYPLHLAFVLLAIAPAFVALGGRPGPWLPLSALGIGLGLAHHRIIVLVIPAVALALAVAWLTRRYRPAPAAAGLALLALLLPLLTYLYLPWRAPELGFDGWRAIVFADRFAGFLDLAAPLRDPSAAGVLVGRIDSLLPPWAWLLATAGAVALAVRRPLTAVVLAALVVPQLWFVAAYRVPDAAVYLLPLAPLAAWSASQLWFPLAALAGRLPAPAAAATTPAALPQPLLPALAAALALIIGAGLWLTAVASWTAVDASQLDQPGRLASAMPVAQLPPGATVIADVGRYAPLLAATRLLSDRADIEVVLPEDEPLQRRLVEREIARGRPAYLARFLPGIERDFALGAVGPLTAVRPPESWGNAAVLGVFTPGIALIGARTPPAVASDAVLRLDLTWAPRVVIDPQYQVRLVAIDALNNRVVLTNGRDPVNGLYATRFWRPGERVDDSYDIPIERRLPPGDYRLELELGVPFSNRVAPLDRGDGGRLPLGTVQITPGAAGNPWNRLPLRTLGDRLVLEGYRPDPLDPGAVQLHWLGRGGPVPFVIDAGAGAAITAVTGDDAGRYGSVQRPTQRERDMPLLIRAGVPGDAWMAHCDWPRRECPSRPLDLPRPRVDLRATARFGNLVAITRSALRIDPASRTVSAELDWEVTGSSRDDYTLSVQLLDDQGRLVTQLDRQPGDGQRPSSGWRPGDRLTDRVSLLLPAGARPGRYEVIAALYLPSTFKRLPLLGPDGRPVADHLALGSVTLP